MARSLVLLSISLLVCFLSNTAVANLSFDDMESFEGHDIGILLNKRQDNNSTFPTPSDGVIPKNPPPSKTTDRPAVKPTIIATSKDNRTKPSPTKSPLSSQIIVSVPTQPPDVKNTKTFDSQIPKPAPTSAPLPVPTTHKKLKPSASTKINKTVFVTRIGDSDVTTTMYTTLVDIVTPTGYVVSTPTTAPDNSRAENGLKPPQRNIIIGVVVGVGGAIILGGLSIVLWRLRRKDSPVDEDDLMRRDGSPLADSRREAHIGGTDASPFRATLDQYHNRPNASSNF